MNVHIERRADPRERVNQRGDGDAERDGVVKLHRLAEWPEVEAPDASRPRSCRSGPFKSDGSRRAGALALLLAVCGHLYGDATGCI
jgi:hypothetical protein